jgi:hypothetical protein
VKNPIYKINVKKEDHFDFYLFQKVNENQKPFAISFHLFRGEKDDHDIIEKSKSYNFFVSINLSGVKLSPGDYSLMVSTYNPNEFTSYQLFVHSNLENSFILN